MSDHCGLPTHMANRSGRGPMFENKSRRSSATRLSSHSGDMSETSSRVRTRSRGSMVTQPLPSAFTPIKGLSHMGGMSKAEPPMNIGGGEGTPMHVPREATVMNARAEPGPYQLMGDGAPVQTPGLSHMRARIQEELARQRMSTGDAEKISPSLARLRSTPGCPLRERQKELINKHEQIRQNSDKLNVGGGVALWPNMNEMRLSPKEVVSLTFTCFGLMAATGWLFLQLHGDMFDTLGRFTRRIESFSDDYPIKLTGDYRSAIQVWHSEFRNLLDAVQKMVNVGNASGGYKLYISAYVGGLTILLYFLIDNMFSKSKLSPARVKKWVCLLVVVGQWTFMLFTLFVAAHRMETTVINNVYHLGDVLGEFIARDMDVSTLSPAVQYWQLRCLSPSGRGVVRVLGQLSVTDAATYLQYYSFPLLTVLLTPVVRLALSLKALYGAPHHSQHK